MINVVLLVFVVLIIVIILFFFVLKDIFLRIKLDVLGYLKFIFLKIKFFICFCKFNLLFVSLVLVCSIFKIWFVDIWVCGIIINIIISIINVIMICIVYCEKIIIGLYIFI